MPTIPNRAMQQRPARDDRREMAVDDPWGYGDWAAYRAARDRFFAGARPQAMDDPPLSPFPDVIPEAWNGGGGDNALQ